jgi:hypothetical protein
VVTRARTFAIENINRQLEQLSDDQVRSLA